MSYPKIQTEHNVSICKCEISSFVDCFSFSFLAVPVIRSHVHTMAVCCLLVISLYGFAIILRISMCKSCDSFYLNKWEEAGPLYRETEGSAKASKSLFVCSLWCAEKSSCTLMSWTPGSCWQVRPCGTLIVTGSVYDLKKGPVGWYLFCFADIYVLTRLLWTLILVKYCYQEPSFFTIHIE